MLFDVGPAYTAMLIPVPFRAGVEERSSVDDLYTPYWVHSRTDDDWWENLGRYKLSAEVGDGDGVEYFSAHFSDQMEGFPWNFGVQAIGDDYYARWRGAVLVIRIDVAGLPMSCAIDDLMFSGAILAK